MFKPKTLRQFMLLSAFALVASTKAMVAMDARAQKSLSATDTRGDSYEERMMRPFAAKIASEMERLAPSLRLELSSDKEKMISTFFKESNVESAEGNLFASEQYQLWASRVFDNYKDSAMAYMFRELKKHFDDYKLALLIVEGRASLKTEDVAKEYFNLQIENWVANKKNDLDVFRALKLDNGEGSVFKNPLLETYVSFARRLPREDLPDEQPIFSELYTMLEQKFGVVGVAEMLGAANVDLREGSVGNRVMYALFRDIALKGPKGSLDYVKNVFNDNAVVDSSAVSIWLSYAKWSLDGVDYERLVTGMVDGLWNEREVKVKALATVIAAAQKDASTRDAATNTLTELFVEWRNEQMTTSNVLNILGLKPTKMKAEDMTESPLLEAWFALNRGGVLTMLIYLKHCIVN